MSNKQSYLDMQKQQYENEAKIWSLTNRDPVVGSYDQHNAWNDYDTLLFKNNMDTSNFIALEYGCGPGRNIIRFANRFIRIDGVDIADNNIIAAKNNLTHNNITIPNLYRNDGSTLSMINDETYDIAFSVICLQHIACYDVRFSIFNEIYRVLKIGGHFCFQMGFGGKSSPSAGYFDNAFDATVTNGGFDVVVDNEKQLTDDLIDKIGFTNYQSDISNTGPGDTHNKWIWIQVTK